MTIAPAAELCSFIDASPTPFHVCRTVASELDAAGYRRLDERDAWPTQPGEFYVVRGGSLVAWSTSASDAPSDAFRVV
ncbi:MAG: family aminopeptidase, partial [Aeromicrobium sp.]|nr:family aminopeptidase [Aeromicrobium sp.]